jgi:hypothetical protein
VLAGALVFITYPAWYRIGPAYCAWAGSMGLLAVGSGVSLILVETPIEDESADRPLPSGALGDERIRNSPR